MTFTVFIALISRWVLKLAIGYYLTVNAVYSALLVAAVWSIRRQSHRKPLVDRLQQRFPAFAPSISVLAPAYNEQETIVQSVKSFLLLNYPSYEVVVINDGSKDATLPRLIEAFKMEPSYIAYDARLSTAVVRGMYRSALHPNLIVIDKENGGKADALNVGLGYSQHELFCAVDSDSLLEENALLIVARPFLEDPVRTIASGGTVRVANGANVKYGRVEKIELPSNPLVLMQIIEYTRAFLCGRIGWNVFNSTLIISGAFGLFSKEAVFLVGGYERGSVGEDIELVVRMHRLFRSMKREYSIVFVPDPVCWTEAPATFGALQRQRNRWQRGLAETLVKYRRMVFNPRYGYLGLLAFPYYLFAELLGPVIEVVALVCLLVVSVCGEFDPSLFKMYFLVGILYGIILSIGALVIEEVYFCKYGKIRQFMALFGVALGETFGYRQLTAIWRLMGLARYLKGDKSWDHLSRVGFTEGKQ